jgi:putative cell wall-binding protein
LYIIGLQGAISTAAEEQASKAGGIDKANIIRIGGTDRFVTSLEVAKYFQLISKIACVATGSNFPDALAGSLYAAKNNAPIILVDKTLSEDEQTYLKNSNLQGVTIFGGEGAVNKDIEQQINSFIEQ